MDTDDYNIVEEEVVRIIAETLLIQDTQGLNSQTTLENLEKWHPMPIEILLTLPPHYNENEEYIQIIAENICEKFNERNTIPALKKGAMISDSVARNFQTLGDIVGYIIEQHF